MMAVTTGVVFATVAVGVALILTRLLRNGRLREKYAAIWILIGTAILVLAAFPGLLVAVSRWFGVQVPSNLLFFLAILLLLAVCLHLSLELSKLEDETRILAEEVAILRLELEAPHSRRDRQAPDGPGE